MNHIIIYTDGGARGNPGPAGAGAVITDNQGNVLHEVSDYLGETTNNIAEYEALIRALKATHKFLGEKLQHTQVDVRMDSELIVRQMEGKYKVKNPALKERFTVIAELREKTIPHLTFTHVRREFNKHADKLVNEAIDRGK